MSLRNALIALAVGLGLIATGCDGDDKGKKAEAADKGAADKEAADKGEPGKQEGAQKAAEEAKADEGSKAPAGGDDSAKAAAAKNDAAAAEKKAPANAAAGMAKPPAPAGNAAAGKPAANEKAPNAADAEAARAKAAQDERQKKLQKIYELGRKADAASLEELKKIMNGNDEAGIRATAIRVLGRERKDDMVKTLTGLTQSKDLPVKMEAAIVLYQWGEKKVAGPLLDELSGQGVALRRAFLTGREDGKNIYDPAAKKFLRKGLKSDNVYTRLDAALGLYELGDDKTALGVFNDVMQKEETFYVRMAALNYLRHLKDDPKINKVITAAKSDKDERVRKRAEQILAEDSKAVPVKGGAAK